MSRNQQPALQGHRLEKMMSLVKILGINDDVTTCECCGRAGLKKTVVLDMDGSQVHYGTQCAAKTLRFGAGATKSPVKIEAEAKLAAANSSYAFKGAVWTA